MKSTLRNKIHVSGFVSIFGMLCLALFSFQHQIYPPTIFLIGDSTMSPRENPVEIEPSRGWGQSLGTFFDPEVLIRNYAVGGRSSKSYLSEGRWEKVLDELRPGDFVLIQFGHNDAQSQDPRRFTNPTTAYYHNLARFAVETRQKGATPILLTPIVVRNFNEHGVLIDTHGLYPVMARQVARDLNVLLVDHHTSSETEVIRLGVEKSKNLYVWLEPGDYENYPEGLEDNVHLSEVGAETFAGLVAADLLAFDISLNKYNLLRQ